MLLRDIVDTEPSDGNVYKMLLGSFIDFWDSMNDISDADDSFGVSLSQSHLSNGSGGSDVPRAGYNAREERTWRHASGSSQSEISPRSIGGPRNSDAAEHSYFVKVASPQLYQS